MVGGLFCFFFPPRLYYREEYEYRILLVILYVTLNIAFENENVGDMNPRWNESVSHAATKRKTYKSISGREEPAVREAQNW